MQKANFGRLRLTGRCYQTRLYHAVSPLPCWTKWLADTNACRRFLTVLRFAPVTSATWPLVIRSCAFASSRNLHRKFRQQLDHQSLVHDLHFKVGLLLTQRLEEIDNPRLPCGRFAADIHIHTYKYPYSFAHRRGVHKPPRRCWPDADATGHGPSSKDGQRKLRQNPRVRVQNISSWFRIGFQNPISSGRCARRGCIG